MRPMLKKIIPIVLVAVLMFTLASCDAIFDAIDDPVIREKTVTMLDAIINDDFDTAYAMVADVCTKAEFEPAYVQIHKELEGIDNYELTALHFNYSSTNGQTYTEITYHLETEKGNYVINSVTADGYNELYYFGITREEDSNLHSTGTIGNMDGANAFQWVMLAVAVAQTVFVIIVFIDCCRKKIKYKALWIFIIIFGALTFGLTKNGSNINFTYNLGAILSHSALIIYGDGSYVFRLLVPIGAILYLIFRKKIIIHPAQHDIDNNIDVMNENGLAVEDESYQEPIDTENK